MRLVLKSIDLNLSIMVEEVVYKRSQVWSLACHICIGSFVFVYTLGVFNTCTDNISASLGWNTDKDFYINLFSTFISIGETIGCLLTPPAISRYGRRKFFIAIDSLFIIGSIILVIPHTIAFGVGRMLTGIAIGAMAIVTPIFLSEITPVAMMSRVGPLVVITENIGLLCSYGLGLMLPVDNFTSDPLNNLWILMFLLPAAFCCYQMIYFFFIMKYDSPQFYLSKQMHAEAGSALEITHLECGVRNGLRRINSDVQGKSISGNTATLRNMICERRFCKMTRSSFFLPLIYQLSGFIAILFYSTSIFSGLGVDLFQSRLITLFIGIVLLASSLASICLLEYFGRKRLIIVAQVMVAIDLALLGLFSDYIPTNPIIPAVFLVAFFIPMGFGLDTALWMYASETLNDQLMSLMCIFNFTFSIPVTYLFPIAASIVGIGNCFFFFAICMATGIIYSLVDVIETKDKSKDEILVEMKVLSKRVVPGMDDSENIALQHVWNPEESVELRNHHILIYDSPNSNNLNN